jgi:hypothetical protein
MGQKRKRTSLRDAGFLIGNRSAHPNDAIPRYLSIPPTFRESSSEFRADFTGCPAAIRFGPHDDFCDVQRFGKCPARPARGAIGGYEKRL